MEEPEEQQRNATHSLLRVYLMFATFMGGFWIGCIAYTVIR